MHTSIRLSAIKFCGTTNKGFLHLCLHALDISSLVYLRPIHTRVLTKYCCACDTLPIFCPFIVSFVIILQSIDDLSRGRVLNMGSQQDQCRSSFLPRLTLRVRFGAQWIWSVVAISQFS